MKVGVQAESVRADDFVFPCCARYLLVVACLGCFRRSVAAVSPCLGNLDKLGIAISNGPATTVSPIESSERNAQTVLGEDMSVQPLVAGSAVVNLLVFVIGGFLLFVGFRAYRFGRVIRDTPTANPGSVAAGRAEVEGTVEPHGEPIEAPFTGEECVCLDWTLEERVKDGDEYEWVERAAETRVEPFYLEGDTGDVLVCADKHPNVEELPWEYDSRRFDVSEEETVEEFLREYRRADDGRGTRTNPAVTENPATTTQPGVTDSEDGMGPDEVKWRYIKRLIPPGTSLYVFGSLEPQSDRSGVGFETDQTTGRFIISRTSEKWTAAGAYWLGLLALTAGLLFVLWGGAFATGIVSAVFVVSPGTVVPNGDVSSRPALRRHESRTEHRPPHFR